MTARAAGVLMTRLCAVAGLLALGLSSAQADDIEIGRAFYGATPQCCLTHLHS